jgi:hypothetical protein
VTEEIVMQFALLIYQNWTWIEEGIAESELAEVGKQYAAIAATPGLMSNLPLGRPKDAVTVRVQNGKTISAEGTVAGPGATAGSVYVFEADAMSAAIEFASRIPAARLGGAIEIRPVGQYW